nr:hypothetical protein [Tanacetum cinerariifolium]
MVACLEKTEENAEFHKIVYFLSTCSITYALTVSPIIYASYIEQFWNTATSKIVNSVKQIHAIVDEKVVIISESSVRSDCWVILCINPLYLNTVSFGVDAAKGLQGEYA